MKPTWASCRLRKKISLNGQLSNLTSTVKSRIAPKFWRRLLTTTLMRWSIYALTSGSSRLWFRLMTRWRNASRYSNRITSGTCPWSCRVTGCVWVWLLERTCLSTCRCEDWGWFKLLLSSLYSLKSVKYTIKVCLWFPPSFLFPFLALNAVDVCILVLVSICVYFLVFTKESSLVKSVLHWHVSSLANLIQLCVE